MEDNLDDFFAKKDRKKTGGKKVTKSGNLSTKPTAEANPKPSKEESEWKIERDEKDYSGLKIQSMTIKDKEEEFLEARMQEERDVSNAKVDDPWKKKGISDDEDEATEEVQPEKVAPAPASATADPTPSTQKYIPIHMRNRPDGSSMGMGGSGGMGMGRISRQRGAPAIGSKLDFPTLGATEENVRKAEDDLSRGHLMPRSTGAGSIQTSNRYDALRKHLQS